MRYKGLKKGNMEFLLKAAAMIAQHQKNPLKGHKGGNKLIMETQTVAR